MTAEDEARMRVENARLDKRVTRVLERANEEMKVTDPNPQMLYGPRVRALVRSILIELR